MIDNPSWQHFATHDESEYPELWRGVRGYWASCLGPSGTRLHDVGGRNNWGTLTNMDAATDWVTDAGRYALDFDGTDDFCDLPGTLSLARATISCWCKLRVATPTSASKTSPPFAQDSNNAASHYTWTDGLIYIEALRNNRVTVTPSATVNRASWHLLTISNNGIRYRVYQNNILVHDSSATAIPTSQFCIGRTRRLPDQVYWFDGLVSDAILWDRGLSANEVDQLYQIGRGGMLTPRRRRRAYFVQTFSPSWASGSNVVLQPSIGVS